MPYKDKAKQSAYQMEWIHKRRESWFAENGPCVACGSWEDLELDHVDPRGKTTHRVWSWAKKRREKELTKCQPLCHNCHQEKTSKYREPPHGTHGRYVHRGCRCDDCKAAHAIVNSQYR